MSIDPELLALLRCPETMQPLGLAPADLVERACREGWTDRNGHAPVGLRQALVREDGQVLFPIEDGIPILLPEATIRIPQRAR